MGWRQRFNPSRLRVDNLRERAKRLADIRTLGDQVAHVRRVGFRGEVLVPIVAVLILAVTLGLSALAPDSGTPTTVDGTPSIIAELPSTVATAPNLDGTATSIDPNGYPAIDTFPSASTPGFGQPNELTATAVVTDSTEGDPSDPNNFTAYPPPDNFPQGVGAPPSSSLPPFGNDNVASSPAAPLPIATPYLIPTPVRSTSGSGGYPPPVVQPPVVPPPPVAAAPRVPTSRPAARPSQPAQPVTSAPAAGGGDSSGYPIPDDSIPEPSDDEPSASEGAAASANPVASPSAPPEPTPVPPTPVPPTATPRPAEVLSGNVRWTAANSPIVVSKDQIVPAGSFLTIEPGVEVQFGPGVQLSIGGTLRAGGNPAAPVRLVGPSGRWDGIVGTPGSTISLDAVQVRQAAQNGTAISSSGGTLVVRNSTLSDNGGGIVALGSVLDLRNTQISGNAIGGPAVNFLLPKQNGSAIVGNIIGGNGTPQGAPQLLITGDAEPGDFLLENNSIIGELGPGAIVNSSAPLSGRIRCNAFNKGTVGLQLSTTRPDASGFNLAIDTNAFTGQSRFGAAGSVAFNLLNNWWGDPSGPLDAQRNPQGRGVPVGVNLQFQPWLTERPACAPR